MLSIIAASLAATLVGAAPSINNNLLARSDVSSTISAAPSTRNTACAVVSAASASYASAYPKQSAIYVKPDEAIECLNSIPIYQKDATQLLASLRTYFEFQSDKEYLKDPPDGYTNPAYDLDADLDAIQVAIDSGAYQSEYDFQLDIYYAISQAFDGHFRWNGDILGGLFLFTLDPQFEGLTSVSIDGIQDPQVYFVSDLLTASNGSLVLRHGYKASPVTKMNGMAITDAIETLALLENDQDPDARYNNMLFILGRISNMQGDLSFVSAPPRNISSYDFQFANGSSCSIPILASVRGDFSNVTDGQSAYETFALFANLYEDESTLSFTSSSASPTSTMVLSATSTSAPLTTATTTPLAYIPGFPYPIVKDDSDTIAAYYLNGTGFEDVAVLQITGFEPSRSIPDDYLTQFQQVLKYFLSSAKNDSKTKLIIDVQGNGGGIIDLATDTFVQLFPNIVPNQSGNIRRSAGMDIIVKTASGEVTALPQNTKAEDEEASGLLPFDYQYNVSPDNVNIDTLDQFLNGITHDGTNFTAFFQTNFTDPLASAWTGFNITQSDPKAVPVFSPENVIVVTDGNCASSCTVFSEHLKNQVGVQFILFGGRPNHGPVQAVGGIKGSQIFDFVIIDTMYQLFQNATDQDLASVNGTEWDYFNEYAMARTATAVRAGDPSGGASDAAGGVNGRNAFRLGDDTHTPLQYVYDAADCRVWYTPEMLVDPTFLWKRVAGVAFSNRTGLAYDSPYCVAGSTGHPTAISGGWKRGTLGPQEQGLGERNSSIFDSAPWNSASDVLDFDWSNVTDATSFGQICTGYNGNNWPVRLFCKLYNKFTP